MSAVHGGTISPPQTQKRDRHFFPLKPHELLRDTTERIFDCLASLLQKLKTANKPLTFAWLVHESGDVEIYPLAKLLSDTAENADDEDADEGEKDESPSNEKTAEKVRKLRVLAALADATLILPASLGGIDETGLLSPTASASAATPPALPPLPPPSAPSVSEHREQVPLPTPASLTPSEKSALLARLDLRIAALLRKALLQSGIPEKLVASAEIEWRDASWLAGVDMSARYAVPDQHRHFRRLHIRIRWRSPSGSPLQFSGPFCIGSGRHTGLGLLAPAP